MVLILNRRQESKCLTSLSPGPAKQILLKRCLLILRDVRGLKNGGGGGGWLLFLCRSRRYTAKHKMMSNFFKHDINHTNSILTVNGSPIALAAAYADFFLYAEQKQRDGKNRQRKINLSSFPRPFSRPVKQSLHVYIMLLDRTATLPKLAHQIVIGFYTCLDPIENVVLCYNNHRL